MSILLRGEVQHSEGRNGGKGVDHQEEEALGRVEAQGIEEQLQGVDRPALYMEGWSITAEEGRQWRHHICYTSYFWISHSFFSEGWDIIGRDEASGGLQLHGRGASVLGLSPLC